MNFWGILEFRLKLEANILKNWTHIGNIRCDTEGHPFKAEFCKLTVTLEIRNKVIGVSWDGEW